MESGEYGKNITQLAPPQYTEAFPRMQGGQPSTRDAAERIASPLTTCQNPVYWSA